MSNRALEIVLREIDAIAIAFNDSTTLLEQIKDLEKEQVAFFKSVDKFSKTGDLKQLEPYLKDCNLEGLSSKQSDIYSTTGTILSETSQENFTYLKTQKAEILECQPGKENIKIKSEDMPAPSWVPPLKKKVKAERPSRSTRSKSKLTRDSDVILQQPEVLVIDLSDDDAKTQTTRTTRSTRTKAKKEAEAAVEPEVEPVRSTRTKTRAKKEPEVKSVEVEPIKSRTKTIRKAKNDEPPPTEEEQPENAVRSTRTKTIRKGKGPTNVPPPEETIEAPVPETKNTKTKTIEIPENSIPLREQEFSAKRIPGKPVEPQPKRSRTSDEDEIPVESKKNKSDSPILQTDTSPQSVYNDAISNPASLVLDATYVAAKPARMATDVTAANSNSKNDQNMFNIFNNSPVSNLLTDDESIEIKTPLKQTKTVATTKEVFSPYEKTTLKKKVEAFERLQNGSEIPLKQGTSYIPTNPGSSIKEKSKAFTPQSKFLPLSSSTSKVTKILGISGTTSALRPRSSQKDPREQLKRQLDREQANKKKEAMLQQQAELKRKQNKEKHLKALQQRKALEAEKMRHLELQKQKDEEKRKQIEQERELNYLKYKQEQEKKHQLQKMRLMQVQKHADGESQKLPIYMISKVPCLVNNPAADDSTEEVLPPRWCRGDYLRHLEMRTLAGGHKLKNTLFGRRPRTADLVDIFEVIDAGKLKRNSSAIWKKPPRYTMMNLNDTQFSEDDEVFSD